ncbi:MAG: flavin reductase family protein [Clostridia bacterium]|nr:flavin reductase family protein [Clostridia bacterium]
MKKISVKPTNDYCPQTLFLYGTYNENGKADFGLFCWFSYTWDGELGVMACIGGSKRTLDNIHREKVFSASLVTEKLLPLSDYLGNTDGNDPAKMEGLNLEIEKGQVLPVPVLAASPVTYELEVKQFMSLHDGEVMLCAIRNVLQDEMLAGENASSTEKLAEIAPVKTTCNRYFSWKGENLGAWGEPMAKLSK